MYSINIIQFKQCELVTEKTKAAFGYNGRVRCQDQGKLMAYCILPCCNFVQFWVSLINKVSSVCGRLSAEGGEGYRIMPSEETLKGLG